MKHHDLIAIGDVVTDEFIRIKDAHVNCKLDSEACELCVRFGDKIPYESVETVHAVGNAANAAVAATRLGVSAALVAHVGGDQLGEKILETLSMNDVSTEFIGIHEDMPSNHHFVLQYGAERTILVKHQHYPYALPDIGEPTWIYLTSLGENSLDFHREIVAYLDAHPSVKLAFQPGTFQIKMGTTDLQSVLAHTHVFFCNKQEAQTILKDDSLEIKDALTRLAHLGPKIVVITDGPNGALAHDAEQHKTWSVTMYPDPKDPVDRTGAGDAFAATVTSALALGKSLPDALMWGPINSMSVVQYVGAQKGLLTADQLNDLLSKAPSSYQTNQIS